MYRRAKDDILNTEFYKEMKVFESITDTGFLYYLLLIIFAHFNLNVSGKMSSDTKITYIYFFFISFYYGTDLTRCCVSFPQKITEHVFTHNY